MTEDTQQLTTHYEPHRPARPMTIVKDERGDRWICDKGVDPTKGLREQGCWNCGEMAFSRDD